MIHNQRYFACSVGHCFGGIWCYLFWQHSAFTLVVITTAGELDSRSRYYRTLRSVEEEVPLPQFKCFIFLILDLDRPRLLRSRCAGHQLS